MAAGDIALRLLITGEASGAIAAMGGLTGAVKNAVSGIGSGLSGLAFGFKNFGVAGTMASGTVMQDLVKMGGGFLALGAIVAVAIAGIAVAIGIKAVKAAGDFQAALVRLSTSAGESQSALKMVGDGILKISVDTATSTDMLTTAMYKIESSNYHAADGLKVLTAASQGAKTENADLTTVTQALLGEMTNYHLKAGDATSAMNGLIAVVKNGNTTLQDLSSSMSQVLPTAASLGISFAQVGGAVDTMTSKTMPARQAAQNLAHVLVALSAPSKVAVKSMTEVGLSAQGVKDALVQKGLPQALQMIEDAIGKKFPPGSVAYVTAMKNIMGGLVGFKTAAQLTGASLKDTQNHIDAITLAMKNGKGAVDGFAQVQQTFNFKVDQAKAAVGAWLIQLGTKLIPIFQQMMTVLLPIIMGFLNWVSSSGILQNVLQTLVNVLTFLVNAGTAFYTFLQNNAVAMDIFKAVLIAVAIIIGGVMVAALVAAAVAAWGFTVAMLANPIVWIAAAIIAAIALIVLAVMHWGAIAHWLQGVWSAIAGFFVGLWNGIKSVAITVWNAIIGFFKAVFTPIGQFFQAGWNNILSMLSAVWNGIKMAAFVVFAIIVAIIIAPFLPLIDWFKAHWGQILAVLTTVWNVIKDIAVYTWNLIVTAIMTPINAVKTWLDTNWHTIQAVISGVWNAISGLASSLWNTIVNNIKGPITTVKTWLSTAWDDIKKAFSNVMGALGGIAKSAWDGVVSVVKGAVNGLIDIINGIIGGINNVTSHVGIPSIPMIPHLARGGFLAPGEVGLVGEEGPEYTVGGRYGTSVISNAQSFGVASRGSFASGGNHGGTTQHIHVHPAPVYLDKRQIGQILFDYQASEVRKQSGVRNR
jgi:TP901 family phage tail tape measure protein